MDDIYEDFTGTNNSFQNRPQSRYEVQSRGLKSRIGSSQV